MMNCSATAMVHHEVHSRLSCVCVGASSAVGYQMGVINRLIIV